jgi:predicted TIM-barrel fold metal-dependent hydrolase
MNTAPAFWDCHAHAFGPVTQFPAVAGRAYEPPKVRMDEHLHAAREAGVDSVVWVQPSIYGLDNAALLSALEQGPAGIRAVIAPPAVAGTSELRPLRDLGVRGLRLNLISKGGNTLETLRPFHTALVDLGWHVAAFLDATDGEVLQAVLGQVDVPVVLDHFGYAGGPAPTVDAFSELYRHMDSGRVWVKLSAPYQLCAGAASCDAASSLAHELLRRNPERVLFGSNWPHVGQKTPSPFRQLLETTRSWIVGAGLDPVQVLGINPSTLYA